MYKYYFDCLVEKVDDERVTDAYYYHCLFIMFVVYIRKGFHRNLFSVSDPHSMCFAKYGGK